MRPVFDQAQAQARVLPGYRGESPSIICHRHLPQAVLLRQSNADFPGRAVLEGVIHCFLCDAVKMRGRIGVGQQDRLGTEELAFDSRHRSGAGGEFGQRQHQAVGLERDGREVVGEQACSRDRLSNVSSDLLGGFDQFRRCGLEPPNERLAQ